MKGIAPLAIVAILVAAGIGVGTPTAMAEMQHRNMTTFMPGDLPYGVMRAGEAVMGLYQPDKAEWYGEMERVREREKNTLQQKCPECTEQIQQLEQERTRLMQQQQDEIMKQERERTETENRAGEGSGTQTETQTQSEGSPQGAGSQSGSQQGK
jgi:hypothetical protein